MCGIFGIFNESELDQATFLKSTKCFFELSRTRGQDSSGLANLNQDGDVIIHRRSMSPEKFVASDRVQKILSRANQNRLFIGHSRLATNGPLYKLSNNQPQYTENSFCIHNGIITNIDELWKKHADLIQDNEVDTEFIPKFIDAQMKNGKTISQAITNLFAEAEGTISLGMFSKFSNSLVLSTNNGSLYYFMKGKAVYFASEKLILQRFLKKMGLSGYEIIHAPNNQVIEFPNLNANVRTIVDTEHLRQKQIDNLKRCTKCVLPETFPGIHFDAQGVCNICHTYVPYHLRDRSKMDAIAEDLKKNHNGKCISMLSGGRDSSYQLHILAKELGLKPIAYTYDWGMVTDIARRNCSRMCQKLGLEHIIVSADIRKKREYIRKNINAWISKPHLGMLPILMVGDKRFLYYGNKIKKVNDLEVTFIGACPYEKTNFKTGFAGISEGAENNVYSISLFKKFRLVLFYVSQILKNPKYLNSSLWDGVKGFFAAYMMKHDFVQVFDYFNWSEDVVDSTLKDSYDWEYEKNFSSTWRIGDGTAAFYNYAYFTLAGFTEFDTFRSNQIRENQITRDEALKLLSKNNRPRWDSLEWYSKVVGFDLSTAINSIHESPSLYE